MLLKEYATNKAAQQFLKIRCKLHAYTMRLDSSDVLSLAHERLAVQIAGHKKLNDEKHFMNTLKFIAYRSALDLKNRVHNVYEKSEDPSLIFEPAGNTNQNYEAKDLLYQIDRAIRKKYGHKIKLIQVYERCIIGGHKLEETAQALSMPINTVKTNMRMVRTFANQELLKLN